MQIAAILLTLGVLILVGLFLYTPFLERSGRRITEEEHELSSLMAERDRAINSLQELDFDFKLGKIPEGEYPAQRVDLLQKGADILRKIDSFSSSAGSAQNSESRIRSITSLIALWVTLSPLMRSSKLSDATLNPPRSAKTYRNV